MLQISQPLKNYYHNIKCGEIYCISPAVFNVTCCLCITKMHLEQFASHFQIHHLTLAEESINLEEFDPKRKVILDEDANLINNIGVKEVDPEEDPIKQEEVQINENDKILKQLMRETEDISEPQQLDKESSEAEETHVRLGEKHETEIMACKPFTRYSKKLRTKADIKLVQQKEEADLLAKESEKQFFNENTKENRFDSQDLETDLKENEDDDNDTDMDWSNSDKWSKSESDDEKTNIPEEELPYPCLICKRSFRSKGNLKKHENSVHNPNKPLKKTKLPKKEHKCDECNEIFKSDRALRGHKLKHTGLTCDICGKTFKQPHNIIRHKIRHSGIKAHKCKECGKDFFTDSELQNHMFSHTNHRPFICEICGRPCRHQGMLRAHMRRHTGERPAKCETCGKSFFSIHDLNLHAVTHSSERPFKCEICGSTFQRKKSLRIHKRIHSDDRKHVCKVCGKGFAQSSGLNSHMRTHDAALEKTTTETAAIFIPAIENANNLRNNTTISSTDDAKVANNTAAVSIVQEISNINLLVGQYIL